LGFDKVIKSISDDSFKLLHRSDFFSSDIQQLLSSVGLNLQNSSFIQSISSPSLGDSSATNLLSTKTFISGVSPIINSSLVIEPGDLGRFLKLSLVPSNASANAGFSLINSSLDSSSDIDLGDWRLSIDDNDPSQAHIGYIGTTPLNQSIADISDLRQLLSSITVLSDEEQSFDVSFQWHSYTDSPTTAVQAPVTLSSLLSSQYDSLIISGASPVTSSQSSTQSLNVDLSHNQADSIFASNLNDSVSLLSTALDSPSAASDTPVIYGFAGNDSIVTSDGSRSVGGIGRDLLIAQRGLGTSQLVGGAGEDMLIGGSNDSLVAGSGDDTLIVRGSGNRLFGGSGSDIFHIHTAQFEYSNEPGNGINRILDFKSDDLIAVNNISSLGHQDIDFNGTNPDATMLITDTAAGAKVSLTGHGDLVILQGISSSQINPEQIVFNDSVPGVTPDIVSQVSLLDQSISSL
jgi:Ca2+-binding RTX toxin-like protein